MLAAVFPGSVHVRALAGVGATDERVWDLAIEHECLLVTKDEDFHPRDRSAARGWEIS